MSPTRDRRAVEHLEQRQVDAGHRLPQPLLAERPGAEALDVGHVRVEHERQRPAARPATAQRSTATKSSARSSGAGRRAKSRAEIAGVKRLVEGLASRPGRRGRGPSPPAARARGRAACARGRGPGSPPPRRPPRTALRNSAARYSRRCQGLSDLLRPRRGQGQQVRGGYVGRAAWPQHAPEVAQHRAGLGHVLDRLEEDHGVAGLAPSARRGPGRSARPGGV